MSHVLVWILKRHPHFISFFKVPSRSSYKWFNSKLHTFCLSNCTLYHLLLLPKWCWIPLCWDLVSLVHLKSDLCWSPPPYFWKISSYKLVNSLWCLIFQGMVETRRRGFCSEIWSFLRTRYYGLLHRQVQCWLQRHRTLSKIHMSQESKIVFAIISSLCPSFWWGEFFCLCSREIFRSMIWTHTSPCCSPVLHTESGDDLSRRMTISNVVLFNWSLLQWASIMILHLDFGCSLVATEKGWYLFCSWHLILCHVCENYGTKEKTYSIYMYSL